MLENEFYCNVCEKQYLPIDEGNIEDIVDACSTCGTPFYKIAEAAIHRLYGGQDYEGNWHFNAFTYYTLTHQLTTAGFGDFEKLEEEHMWKNWTLKVRAVKQEDAWG